jgi:tRNA(Arg) A34 adenosine deaminase TadA
MNDEYFMKVAVEDAKLNGHHFGAIIVKNNEIIAKGGKMPKGNPRFHAETYAIWEACEKLKTRDLKNCTLYSTCEPCPMCFYMAWITNISRIVYGATIQDCIRLGISEIRVTVKFLNKRGGNRIELKGRILRNECLRLLKGIITK